MNKNHIRKIACCSVLSALGFVLMLINFPLPFIIPSFIEFDFAEIPALIASFAYGPVYGILVCAVKNLIHLFVTSTGGVGELSNFLLGAIFTSIAGLVYKKSHNRKGALLGSLIGAFIMSIVSLATNYFIVYPFYTNFMPMEGIIGAYSAILPSIDNLFEALLIFNFPFNFFKGMVHAAVCFAIYKRISPLLKGTGKNIDKIGRK